MLHIHVATNGVWRQHSATSNSAALEKPVQVFSYDSKDDTVYMQTIACGNLSKEETMEVSSDRRRPQVSDFEDADTLRLVYQQHQFIDAGHYNCIISNKVCARSLGARPLSGSL